MRPSGTPVQHREAQGHESALFLSYFKHGIEYLLGGVDTHPNNATAGGVFSVRMLHLKGAHRIRAAPVQPHASSMNSGDVFVLDCGEMVFQVRARQCLKGTQSEVRAI